MMLGKHRKQRALQAPRACMCTVQGPPENIPTTKMHIQKEDKALQEAFDKIETRKSYWRIEHIQKKGVTTLYALGHLMCTTKFCHLWRMFP